MSPTNKIKTAGRIYISIRINEEAKSIKKVNRSRFLCDNNGRFSLDRAGARIYQRLDLTRVFRSWVSRAAWSPVRSSVAVPQLRGHLLCRALAPDDSVCTEIRIKRMMGSVVPNGRYLATRSQEFSDFSKVSLTATQRHVVH